MKEYNMAYRFMRTEEEKIYGKEAIYFVPKKNPKMKLLLGIVEGDGVKINGMYRKPFQYGSRVKIPYNKAISRFYEVLREKGKEGGEIITAYVYNPYQPRDFEMIDKIRLYK